MLKENLQDAGLIIQNILTQQLDIPGASKNVSLLSAAMHFTEKNAASSDLNKIIKMFSVYREHTQILIQELELLATELKHPKLRY